MSNNHCYYNPGFYVVSATKKRYVLEEYPSQTRTRPQYNPLYDTFRPITPPHFNSQFQDTRTSVYDRPYGHYFNNEQHISSNKRNTGK